MTAHVHIKKRFANDAPVVRFGPKNGTFGVVAGPDKNVWFTTNNLTVGVYVLRTLAVSPSTISFGSPGTEQTITVKERGFPLDKTAWSIVLSVVW